MAVDKSDWVAGKILANQAAHRGEAPFMQFEDGRMHTYGEAHRLSNQAGNGFAAAGVNFGENVAVMMNNCLEYLWTWIGLGRIGAIPVAINTALRGTFLTHVLTNTGCRIGVFDPDYLDWLVDIEDDVPDLQTVYVFGEGPVPALKRIEIRSFDEILNGAENNIDVEISYRDIGTVMFTSGTTGPSKGVLMPHGHLYLYGECMRTHMQITPKDKYYITLPLFHAQGLLMMSYGTLIAGASGVLTEIFRASSWIDDIRKYEATLTNLLGAMNDFVLAQPPKPYEGDNKLRMISAIPVTDETLSQLKTRFNVPKFNELFGMTECNLPVARPFDAPEEAGCSGKVWDDYFEVIIGDPETDEELPVGEVGEILVRPKEPYCFMQGYNGMPEMTVQTWRNLWFHTGDAGRQDERGYIWYIDRIKDTIRRRGENISSYEVESVLLEHPAIAEAAAVAVKADQGGEDEVLACLVLKPGAGAPDPMELLDFCVPRMPYFAVPRYIDIVDEIPKTPSAKIQKNKLRELGLSPNSWDRETAGYKLTRKGRLA